MSTWIKKETKGCQKNMKILIDTNIVLDMLLGREPFEKSSTKVFEQAENGKVEAFLTANSITDIVYILRKKYDKEKIRDAVLELMKFIKIVSVTSKDINKAFDYLFTDYEDALQTQCAIKIKADYIVTRNVKDFKNGSVKAITPDKFIEM